MPHTIATNEDDYIKAECIDCKKKYSEFKLDSVLSEEQWKLIHPEKEGLLCAQCIVNRATELPGIIRVDVKLRFANDPL